MNDDLRCCGTGTCLINAEGFCWCGQAWNGAAMCRAATNNSAALEPPAAAPTDEQGDAL